MQTEKQTVVQKTAKTFNHAMYEKNAEDTKIVLCLSACLNCDLVVHYNDK